MTSLLLLKLPSSLGYESARAAAVGHEMYCLGKTRLDLCFFTLSLLPLLLCSRSSTRALLNVFLSNVASITAAVVVVVVFVVFAVDAVVVAAGLSARFSLSSISASFYAPAACAFEFNPPK